MMTPTPVILEDAKGKVAVVRDRLRELRGDQYAIMLLNSAWVDIETCLQRQN
jgi:hypothetical protein